MEKCFVIPEQLRDKFRLKKDLYNLLTIDCIYTSFVILVHFFLPSYDKCLMYYLRKVMSEKKKVRSKF